MSDVPPLAPPPTTDADDVAPPPSMEVRSHVWIAPDGRVVFGALFEELVPVARALDPAALPVPAPAAEE